MARHGGFHSPAYSLYHLGWGTVRFSSYCPLGCPHSSQISLHPGSLAGVSVPVGRVWLPSGRLPHVGELPDALSVSVSGAEDLCLVGSVFEVGKGCAFCASVPESEHLAVQKGVGACAGAGSVACRWGLEDHCGPGREVGGCWFYHLLQAFLSQNCTSWTFNEVLDPIAYLQPHINPLSTRRMCLDWTRLGVCSVAPGKPPKGPVLWFILVLVLRQGFIM